MLLLNERKNESNKVSLLFDVLKAILLLFSTTKFYLCGYNQVRFTFRFFFTIAVSDSHIELFFFLLSRQ